MALVHYVEAAADQGQLSFANLQQAAAKGRMDFFCKAGDWLAERFHYTIYTREHEAVNHSPMAGNTVQRIFAG